MANPSQLTYDLYNDRCDAIVFDAPVLGAARAAAPERYGPFAGRIVTSERYGIAFPKGSPLRASVNAALAALTRDGTIARLQKRWLTDRRREAPRAAVAAPPPAPLLDPALPNVRHPVGSGVLLERQRLGQGSAEGVARDCALRAAAVATSDSPSASAGTYPAPNAPTTTTAPIATAARVMLIVFTASSS